MDKQTYKQNHYIRKFDNSSFCKLNGIGFDPVFERNNINIIQTWITYYSRRTSYAFGYNYRNIYTSISNSIEAFQNRNKNEVDEYLEKYWYDFLIYGVNKIYPNDVTAGYSSIIAIKPQWQTKEDIENFLGISGFNLETISPYS